MKLVIKIGSTGLARHVVLADLSKAVLQLLSEGHQITIIHGGTRAFLKTPAVHNGGRSLGSIEMESRDAALMVLGGHVNKQLVAHLSKAGVAAIGLCGTDGNLLRTRIVRNPQRSVDSWLEVAAVDPYWLSVISQSHGVPVLANVALGFDNRHYSLCADQLAASCAIAWRADALIYLTGAEGVKNDEGNVMRWLEADQIASLISRSAEPHELVSKLKAALKAIQAGVHRIRILPVSQTRSLAGFCCERLTCGTEVILPTCAVKV